MLINSFRNVCIFCDEEDADFNEDTLISHYYNDCPVLTNCPMCQIVSQFNIFVKTQDD